jgi:amidophosphoribosyltransferase
VLDRVPLDPDTIVVPVPDTGKAAADAMAYELGVPSVEGLIRNRYIGRTFIEGQNRAERVQLKYTPLREVLVGKRVLLIEDTIVRSTTMKALLRDLRERGGAREIHVRVACPPIISPCFYGIDMSTVRELFAPRFMHGNRLTEAEQNEMADELGADSLFYLPLEAIARCIGLDTSHLCRGCLTGKYPTPTGERLYQLSLKNRNGTSNGRTYELAAVKTGG